MTKRSGSPSRQTNPNPNELRSLRIKLAEAEQALAAIRSGGVDALVVGEPGTQRLFTLEGADHGYRTLLEAMSEGVAQLADGGIVTYCNACFASLLRRPLEAILGQSIDQMVEPGERERFAALLRDGAHQRCEGEFLLQGPAASLPVPVLLSVVPLVMEGVGRKCLVVTDLTELRRLSDSMAVERSATQARLLVADRMSSMGILAAGVAHEINNPLAYVMASLDLVLRRLPDLADVTGEQAGWLRRQVERAHEGTDRVRLMVRDLKAFSRADDEILTVVDLRRALDTSIALVSSEIRQHARLVQDYDGLPLVRANASRLGQVFVNLLVNASDAIPAGAADRHEIRVSGHADAEGNAVIEIKDSGGGIAPEDLGRIFDLFFTTKPVGVGTGLGLALCNGIVTSFGGRITVESVVGSGSLFRVTIPAVDAARAPELAPPALPPLELPQRRGRILIIDDEQDLCDVLSDSLAGTHEVVTTTDAALAISWIGERAHFDLILCDMRMPQMTGMDFYSKLLAIDPNAAGRLVLMSGGLTSHSGETPLALRGAILEKPFHVDKVQTLMRERLRA